MNRTIIGGVVMGVAGLGLAALAGNGAASARASGTGAPAAEGAFKVDAVHSSVVYRVKHLNVSNFYGRFGKVEGSFALNKADPGKSELSVTIPTDSIDSNNAKRDGHLKSQDFFSAKEFPTITFKGKAFTKKSDTAWEVVGDISLKGVTKPITVTVEDTGTGKGMRGQGEIAGVASTFTIKRSEFGMNYMLDGLSDEVTIMVGLEGAR
ncbi:MAG: YceI family protein [Phycisphaerae bacterium]|nr:YceI family protein [Phycisphaerae bacterium]